MPALRYQDQNNNIYRLQDGQFRYEPIQAIDSSSGTYSGGEPASHTISDDLSDEIFTLASEIFQNPRNHASKRVMMTSILSLKLEDEWQRCTLVRSELRSNLEEALEEALNP